MISFGDPCLLIFSSYWLSASSNHAGNSTPSACASLMSPSTFSSRILAAIEGTLLVTQASRGR